MCYLERPQPSHRWSRGCEARMPTSEQVVANIDSRGECSVHHIVAASLEPGLSQVPCRQLCFVLQRGIGGTVVKLTRGP